MGKARLQPKPKQNRTNSSPHRWVATSLKACTRRTRRAQAKPAKPSGNGLEILRRLRCDSDDRSSHRDAASVRVRGSTSRKFAKFCDLAFRKVEYKNLSFEPGYSFNPPPLPRRILMKRTTAQSAFLVPDDVNPIPLLGMFNGMISIIFEEGSPPSWGF